MIGASPPQLAASRKSRRLWTTLSAAQKKTSRSSERRVFGIASWGSPTGTYWESWLGVCRQMAKPPIANKLSTASVSW